MLSEIGAIIIAWGLPGLALLQLSGLARLRPWSERIILALGIGCAWPSVWMLLTDTLGLRLGAWHVWLPAAASAAGLVVGAWRSNYLPHRHGGLQEDPQHSTPRTTDSPVAHHLIITGTLWGVIGLIVASRLLSVRALVAPMWGDSVQHAVMAQLMLDHGGLFDSWLPYTPYAGLTIQYGFSALAAFFAWAVQTWDADMTSAQATLLTGQWLNAFAVLTLYPLAVKVAGDRPWAGIGALVVAGLLMPTPAFYVNWGRYAQLGGQVILPVAIWLIWEVAERPRLRNFGWAITGLVVAGMVLTYYRMPYTLAAFLLVWFFCWWLPVKHLAWRKWWRPMLALVLAAVTTAVIFLPWVLRLQDSNLSAGMEATPEVTDLFSLESVLADYEIWLYYADYIPLWIGITASAGWILGIILRRGSVILIGLWTLLLAGSVAGRLLALPGSLYLQNFAILIALYIPAAILCGWLLAWIVDQVDNHFSMASQIGAALLIGVAVWWGYPGVSSIVDEVHAMVLPADMDAMAWIRENTPPGAHFLVEGFHVYEGFSIVGADAGWWIPLLAGRANTMPPQYAIMNEQPPESDYNQRLVDLYMGLENSPLNAAPNLEQLCRHEITHVYIGERQGMVGNSGAPLFNPHDVETMGEVQLIYQQSNVWIFAFDQNVCAGLAA